MAEKAKKEGTEKTKVKATETEAVDKTAAPVSEEKETEMIEKSVHDAQVAELKDKHLRAVAELDNFRKRTAREREQQFNDVTALVIGSFLTVYDNLERALAANTADEAFKKGVELTFAEFAGTLKKLGVEEINPKNEKFNPNFHEGVMHIEDDKLGEGVVAEVFQKGFKRGDKIIRPAMVKVAN